jgi:replication-associated recombination protein RarA
MAGSSFEMPVQLQTALAFPEPLTEKYRPTTVDGFVGLEKPRKVMAKLAANPFPSAWYFLGPSGTGKTTLALALAAQMPAELHHIASKKCTHCVPAQYHFHIHGQRYSKPGSTVYVPCASP